MNVLFNKFQSNQPYHVMIERSYKNVKGLHMLLNIHYQRDLCGGLAMALHLDGGASYLTHATLVF